MFTQVPLLRWAVPRQRRCTEAMQIVNTTLDQLISKCKRLVSRLYRAGCGRGQK